MSLLIRAVTSSLLLFLAACANNGTTPANVDVQKRGPVYKCWGDKEPIVWARPDFHITLGCGGRINETAGTPGADGYLWLRLEWW